MLCVFSYMCILNLAIHVYIYMSKAVEGLFGMKKETNERDKRLRTMRQSSMYGGK